MEIIESYFFSSFFFCMESMMKIDDLVVGQTALKNMSSSIGMMKFPIYRQINTVSNHQPVIIVFCWDDWVQESKSPLGYIFRQIARKPWHDTIPMWGWSFYWTLLFFVFSCKIFLESSYLEHQDFYHCSPDAMRSANLVAALLNQSPSAPPAKFNIFAFAAQSGMTV